MTRKPSAVSWRRSGPGRRNRMLRQGTVQMRLTATGDHTGHVSRPEGVVAVESGAKHLVLVTVRYGIEYREIRPPVFPRNDSHQLASEARRFLTALDRHLAFMQLKGASDLRFRFGALMISRCTHCKGVHAYYLIHPNATEIECDYYDYHRTEFLKRVPLASLEEYVPASSGPERYGLQCDLRKCRKDAS